MNSKSTLTSRNFCLALAAAWSMAMAGTAYADVEAVTGGAAMAAATASTGELQQLDEIWVRGKSLSRTISDAEDKFFARYNKLNKNHQYDIDCGWTSLNRGSMIMKRACVANFVTDALPRYTLGSGAPTCGMQNYSYGDINSYSSYGSSMGRSCSGFHSYFAAPVYPQVPVEALLIEHGPRLEKNLLEVIGGDARLQEMVARLDALYGELQQVQSRYVSLKGPDARKPAKPNHGPRVL